MTIIYIISFILLLTGFFIKFNISPKEYFYDLTENIVSLKNNHKENLIDKINKAKKIKKTGYFERIINETKEIMINNGTISNFNKLLNISIVMCIVAIILSIILQNIFLMPILILIFGLIPFYYIKIQNLIYIDAVKKKIRKCII